MEKSEEKVRVIHKPSPMAILAQAIWDLLDELEQHGSTDTIVDTHNRIRSSIEPFLRSGARHASKPII